MTILSTFNPIRPSPSHPALQKIARHSPGFTLIEVVVVIAVLGALMLIAYPALSKWVPNYQLKAAAQELYGNLQKAKLHAVKTNRDVTFNFTNSADCSAATRYIFTDKNNRTVASVNLQAGGVCITSFSFTNDSSGFDPRALPANGVGDVTLSHARLPSRTYVISQTLSGNVSIQ